MNKLVCLPMTFAMVMTAGCSDDGGSGGAGGGSGTGKATTMSVTASASSSSGAASTSKVRVAHLSPDAPPVDFCFKSQGGEVIGPVLEAAGLAQGVAFGQVTPYVSTAKGTYTVQVVSGGAPGCDAPLVEVPNVVVPGGGLEVTAAAVGLTQAASPPFELIYLIDENAPVAGKVKLRFVHAAPGLASVDAGVLPSGGSTLIDSDVVFDSVEYKNTEQPPYATLDPLTAATLRAQLADDSATGVVESGVSLLGGQVATVYAIGTTGDLALRVCVDNEGDGGCGL